MTYCEMCGRDTKRIVSVNIEGAVLKVCPDCARFGMEVTKRGTTPSTLQEGVDPEKRRMLERALERRRRIAQGRDIFEDYSGKELVDDYPERVRRGRERMGMTREDLARKINEKESVIARVESGHITPDDHLIRKLERALKIKLRTEVKESGVKAGDGRHEGSEDRGLTLGDLINIESSK